MLTIYSLYTHLLFASLLFSLLLTILPYKFRRNRVAQAVLGICVIGGGIQASTLFSMFSPNPGWAAWWHGNVRLGVYAFIPLAGYALAHSFIKPDGRLLTWRTGWLLIIPTVTLLLSLSNDWHHWFIQLYEMETRQGVFIRAAWQPGFWFWVHTLYSAAIGLIIFWLLGRWIQQTRWLPRMRGILVVSIVASAMIAASIDTLGISIAPGLILLPLVLGLTDLLLLLGIWHLALLDILPIARETLIRYLPDATFIVDTKNIILDANPTAEQLAGFPLAELIGRDIIQLIKVEERAQRAKELLNREFHGVMPLNVNGAEHFLDILVANIYIEKEVIGARLVVLRDVTPLQSSAEALRASEERLALALKAGAMGVWDWDFKNQASRWDQQMFEIYGLTEPEITHEQWKKLVLPDDLSQAEVLPGHFSPGNEKHVTEFRIQRPDGSLRHIQSVAQAVFQNGNLARMVGINIDITERKEAEAALRASESRYHALVETSPDAITLTDRRGIILACNPQAAALHGFSDANSMLGTNVFQLLLPEELPAIQQSILKAAQTGSVKSIECAMLKKDGSRFAGELSVSVLMGASGEMEGIIGISRDISARKQAEEALRASEERYRLLAENISDVIWILDLESSRFRYLSPSVERLRGYTPEEIMAQDMSMALVPASLQLLQQNLPSRLESYLRDETRQEYFVDELEQPCKDGSAVWTETTTRFFRNLETGRIEVYGVSRDISARKQAEDQLRKLSRAVEQSPASIVITDVNAQIEYVNPRFTQVAGYTLDEALGQTPRILKSGRTPPETYRQLWEALTAGKEWRGEFINRKKNGDLYTESAIISPITDAHGNITHYLAVKEDITELKELQKREVELAAVEERQRLARDLHDAVSQTLFSARLTSEMLLRQRDSLETETIWANIEHLTRLIISALGEMRILLLELRPEGLEKTELPTLLAHLTDALGSRTEAPIQLKVQGQKSLPLDVKIALYRIAQEGLNNIIKHARATEIILTLKLDNAQAVLALEDNGRGFDEQQLPGGQLGLGIMRERAAEIGASFKIESQPGKGTCITCGWKG